MSTPAKYAVAAKFQPDCECCEVPDEMVWQPPNHGIFTVINELNGQRRSVCGGCLRDGAVDPSIFFEQAAPTEPAGGLGDPTPAAARA